MIYKGKKWSYSSRETIPREYQRLPKTFFFFSQKENRFYSKSFVKNKLEDLHKMMKKTHTFRVS